MTNVTRDLRVAEMGSVDPSKRYQLLDMQLLAELYGGDREYAACMFETFVDSVLPEFAVIDQQIQAQCWEEVHPLIHKLRPTLSMVGLTPMEATLILLENLIIEQEQVGRIHAVWQDFYTTLQSQQPLLQTEWQRYLTTPNL
ncbi:Hpt domain-containing protein [Spirosoma aerolatum]|uniref:Hpt domain-containing protein n=1 Tax=Spirosoma aerolatum TaxID=1211326 RepID=UPI0009ADC3ED|nr:Hpt domain-containing protein [Spirosoma aerolatum]